jgi:hypothetical protein
MSKTFLEKDLDAEMAEMEGEDEDNENEMEEGGQVEEDEEESSSEDDEDEEDPVIKEKVSQRVMVLMFLSLRHSPASSVSDPHPFFADPDPV